MSTPFRIGSSIYKQKKKTKFFVWVVCHESLPTRWMLHKMGMLHTAICPKCTNINKIILHYIRDCVLAKQVLHYVDFDNLKLSLLIDIGTIIFLIDFV